MVCYPSLMLFFIVLNYYYGDTHWSAMTLLFCSGAFFWTFLEYMLHRFVFHWASESPGVKRFTYILHGVHHEAPRDEGRVFMPPVPGTLIIALLFGCYYLALGHYAYMFMSGMLLGYIAYSSIHFLIHVKHVPKILKKLHTHHALHHYRYDDKAFGVSTMFWDRVFGTMAPEEKVKG
jgi:sterol desaturase/sphingolipid hydroxylase (fatty acid hydroxylase superfamily)